MSNMQADVYAAFRSIDVPEEKALRAAEALSRRDEDVGDLKRDVGGIKRDVADLKGDVGVLKRDNAVLKWIATTNIALTLAVLLKEFFR